MKAQLNIFGTVDVSGLAKKEAERAKEKLKKLLKSKTPGITSKKQTTLIQKGIINENGTHKNIIPSI